MFFCQFVSVDCLVTFCFDVVLCDPGFKEKILFLHVSCVHLLLSCVFPPGLISLRCPDRFYMFSITLCVYKVNICVSITVLNMVKALILKLQVQFAGISIEWCKTPVRFHPARLHFEEDGGTNTFRCWLQSRRIVLFFSLISCRKCKVSSSTFYLKWNQFIFLLLWLNIVNFEVFVFQVVHLGKILHWQIYFFLGCSTFEEKKNQFTAKFTAKSRRTE